MQRNEVNSPCFPEMSAFKIIPDHLRISFGKVIGFTKGQFKDFLVGFLTPAISELIYMIKIIMDIGNFATFYPVFPETRW